MAVDMGNSLESLSVLRDKFTGKRAFIIGNGPSLNKMDLTKLKDETAFGVNGIFYNFDRMGFKPTFYVVEDKLVAEDRAEEINALTGMVKIFGTELQYCLKDSEDVMWANVIYDFSNYPGFPHFSKNAAEHLWVGGTVSYLCLQLAYYMGFDEVYMIGFDHSYAIPEDAKVEGTVITSASDDPNHFHPEYFGKGKRWHDPRLDRMELAYRKAKKIFEQSGRKIYNATVGGKLDIFPRVDYESLFTSQKQSSYGVIALPLEQSLGCQSDSTAVPASANELPHIQKKGSSMGKPVALPQKPRFSHLVLDYTRLCNSRCTYCGIWKTRSEPELALDVIEKVFASLQPFGLGCCYVTGGEPYISDKVVDIARLLHQYLPNCMLSGATNAVQPEQILRRVEKIQHIGVPLQVHISINGREATHDTTRGCQGFWRKAVYLLETLKSSGVPVVASMSLMPQTIADLPYMQKYWAERDIPLMFSWVRQSPRYGTVDRYHSIWPEELKPKLCQIEYLPDEFDCPGLSRRLVITPDGSLYPCEVYHNDILLGNANKQSLESMINSTAADSILRNIVSKKCHWCQGPGDSDGSPKWMLMDCYRRHSKETVDVAQHSPRAVNLPPGESQKIIESILSHKSSHQVSALDRQKTEVVKKDNAESKVRISVVVCTYRNPDLLVKTLESLVSQTLNQQLYEVIVVDNNSQDSTAEVVAHYPQVRYVLEEKLGLSHARNAGVRAACGDIIAFIDDDAEASPEWLEALLKVYDSVPEAWAVGGKVLPIWDAEKPQWLTQDYYRSLSLVEWGQFPRALRWPERIIGTNCSFKREVFTEIGYFDTGLGRIGSAMLDNEDTEIQQRIHTLGRLVYYTPEATVHHRVPASRMTKEYFEKRHWGGIHTQAVMALCAVGKPAQANELVTMIRHREKTQNRQLSDASCWERLRLEAVTALRAQGKQAQADELVEMIKREKKAALSATMKLWHKVRISVVVCTYRNPDLLVKTLESLMSQTLNQQLYEVIVVDNNSQDSTAEVVACYPQVRYVFEEKLGLSHARNAGVRTARGDIIAFIDDDAEASAGWVQALLKVYDSVPEAWAVGGKVLPIWDAEKPQWLTQDYYRSLSLVEWGQFPRALRWPERIIGTNCSFKREVFTGIGYFDTSLGRIGSAMLGNEDTEIQQRIHTLGHLVYYTPEAVVHHHVPASRMTKDYFKYRSDGTIVSETIMNLKLQGKYQQAEEITARVRRKAESSTFARKQEKTLETSSAIQMGTTHRTGLANSNKGPILVYQMGKVGSRTVYESLKALELDAPVYHVHYLTHKAIENITPDHTEARFLRSQIDRGLRGDKWRIVSFVREPITRNISAFFQNIDKWYPNFIDRYKIESMRVEELIEVFLEKYPHKVPLTWFDSEMKSVFGIDVFSTDFPKSKGYKIYRTEHADLLLIRLEDISKCADQAFEEFLNIDHFTLIKANISSEKEYRNIYKEFVDSIVLPETYARMMYDSKYARHFYSDQELDVFRARWSKPKHESQAEPASTPFQSVPAKIHHRTFSSEQALAWSDALLAQYKDKHRGRRCVIIGNGPSLNKMDLSFLKNEITFGMNRIYLGFEKWDFTPTYYVSVNPLVIEQSAEQIHKIPSVKFLSLDGLSYMPDPEGIIFLRGILEPYFTLDLRRGLWWPTVTYAAMQLAYFVGFSEVILIGVDHYFKGQGAPNEEVLSNGSDQSHFHPDYFGKGIRWNLPDLKKSEQAYSLAKQVFEADGRRIIDATVDGKLTIFPKADYRQIFSLIPHRSESCQASVDIQIIDADVSDEKYLVSAIVSVYNCERYIRGCLEDLIDQTLFKKGQLEIVVVNTGSEQNEDAVIREFQNKYDHVKYIRTEQRETVYQAWNRGIKTASGKYITNANTDDRHRFDALEIMANTLNERKDVGLVNADVLVSHGANETFVSNTAKGCFKYPVFSLRQALIDNVFGPQPMWRRSLHDQIGFFNTDYIVAADYDFFLKAAWKFGAYHIPEILGLYLDGVGFEAHNQRLCRKETNQILKHYRSIIPLEDIYPTLRQMSADISAKVAAQIDFANTVISGACPDYSAAEKYYRMALDLAAGEEAIINNLAVCFYCQGRVSESTSLFQKLAEKGHLLSKQNLERINAVASSKVNLSLAIIPHSVLESLPDLVLQGVYVEQKETAIDKVLKSNPTAIELQRHIRPNFKIGMAVLAHERPEYLEICLDTLFQTELYNYDITFLLQDDGSKDPRVREIIGRKRHPKYQIVRCHTPKGHNSWGAAFNKAMRKLLEIDDFDIIGTCDPDALFHPEWLDKTMKVCLWAKENHKDHILGPFSSFNSSDYKFHKILGTYKSPHGDYVVKKRMGALNYFYFKDDFLKLGFFEEDKNDETLMTEKFKSLGVRNFSIKTSYVEHIGQLSVLNQWRPTPVLPAVYGMNLAKTGWPAALGQLETLGYFRSVRHNASLEPARHSGTKIDILIPVVEKDLEILPLVVDGARENLRHPIGRIIVVAPDSDKIKSVCSLKGCEFVSEDTVLPIIKRNLTYTVDGVDRSGWLFQQLIKLAGDTICSQQHYLALDADTILIRPQVFEVNGKTVLLHSDEHHRPYFDLYERLFGVETKTALSFVSHHMLFEKSLVREFRENLEARHGINWVEALFKNIDASQLSAMSEYELYGQWVFANHPDKITREYWFNISLQRQIYTPELKAKLERCCRSISFHDYNTDTSAEVPFMSSELVPTAAGEENLMW